MGKFLIVDTHAKGLFSGASAEAGPIVAYEETGEWPWRNERGESDQDLFRTVRKRKGQLPDGDLALELEWGYQNFLDLFLVRQPLPAAR